MDSDRKLLIVGILINSALYFTGVFVAGLLTNHPWAWKGALIGVGITYFGYSAQVMNAPRQAQIALVTLSVVAGIGCGLFLL